MPIDIYVASLHFSNLSTLACIEVYINSEKLNGVYAFDVLTSIESVGKFCVVARNEGKSSITSAGDIMSTN